jgi:hypothetical protein
MLPQAVQKERYDGVHYQLLRLMARSRLGPLVWMVLVERKVHLDLFLPVLLLKELVLLKLLGTMVPQGTMVVVVVVQLLLLLGAMVPQGKMVAVVVVVLLLLLLGTMVPVAQVGTGRC